MTLLLDHEDMESLLGVDTSLTALRKALHEQAEGAVLMPPRQTTDAAGGARWLRISSAFLNGSDYMGFKSMNRAAGVGMRYLVALYRISTGGLLALMDANLITTQRTAATSALGTDMLARKDDRTVGIIGSGVQAHAFARAYASLRELESIVVYSPREESRTSFATQLQQELGVSTKAADSPEAVARECDTTVLAMRAPAEPVFREEWLRRGGHVTGLSSVRKDAREVEAGVWSRADIVVADDRGTVFQSGDGLSAAAAGVEPAAVPELWELLHGKVGRTSARQMTLFKSAGNAMQDLAIAVDAYERALALGIGSDLGTFPAVKSYA